MQVYIVSADRNGAYVDSGYNSENLNLRNVTWIATFHDKIQAQSYVSYLNQNYTPFQVQALLN